MWKCMWKSSGCFAGSVWIENACSAWLCLWLQRLTYLGGCQEREVIPRFNRLIGTDTGMLALRKRSTRPYNSFSSALHTKLPSKRSPSIPTCLPRSMKRQSQRPPL